MNENYSSKTEYQAHLPNNMNDSIPIPPEPTSEFKIFACLRLGRQVTIIEHAGDIVHSFGARELALKVFAREIMRDLPIADEGTKSGIENYGV